jgi:molybdenum cofactor biosynthesis protein B
VSAENHSEIPAPAPADQHRQKAPPARQVRLAVVTVSDTRTEATDEGGRLVRQLCQEAGLTVTGSAIVRDEPAEVAAHVKQLVATGQVHAVLLTGGTGISRRDTTVEALAALFDKTLDGFGELFRMLSFAEVGAAAMLSRATAGVIGGVAVFLMPGSPKAVRLALTRLILPELGHIVGQLAGPRPDSGHHADQADGAKHHVHGAHPPR